MPDIKIRRVVNRRVYDTESANCVATIVMRGASIADHHHEYTQLFKTRKGNYFLAGWGGAHSSWARRTANDDGWMEGRGIKPIDEKEARELVERYAPNSYETNFSCEEA